MLLIPHLLARTEQPQDGARIDAAHPLLAGRTVSAFLPAISAANLARGTGILGSHAAPTVALPLSMLASSITTTNLRLTSDRAFAPTPAYPLTMIWVGQQGSTANTQIAGITSAGGIGGSYYYIGGGSSTQIQFAARNNYGSALAMLVAVPNGIALGVELVVVVQSLSANNHRASINGSAVATDTTNIGAMVAWDRVFFGQASSVNSQQSAAFIFASGGTGLSDEQMQQLSRSPSEVYALFEPQRILVPVSSGGPTAITATTSLTAAIQLAQQLSASTSVAVQASQSVSTTVQTAVQAATAASAQLDAAVAQARTATASLEVAVRAAATKTASFQPAVQGSAQQTASLQAAVQQARTATAALDLAAQAAAQQTATLAAYVQAGSSLAASANAAVQAAAQDTASASVAVQSTVTSTASLAAAIATTRTASASLEAAVQAAQSATASLSAQVQAGTTTVAALDAAVRAAAQASSAVQAAVAVVTTTSAGLNAAVAMQRAVSAAADAAIFARRIASSAMSAYIQFGGYVPTGSIAEAVYVPASLKIDVPPDGQYIYVE